MHSTAGQTPCWAKSIPKITLEITHPHLLFNHKHFPKGYCSPAVPGKMRNKITVMGVDTVVLVCHGFGQSYFW